MTHRLVMVLAVSLLAIGLTSCAGEDQMGTARHRLSVWVSGTALGEDVGTLVADNQRISKEVPNGTGAVHSGCGALEDDAEMANSSLPSPDAQVTAWLSQAYGLEGTAGTECYNAGVTDPKLLARAYAAMTRAERLFDRTLIRIQSIDGSVVSTTTTTDNTPGSIFG
jgi:hypothetical protein